MKKLILYILVCCLSSLVFAQQQAPGFLLDQPLTGNQHFQASDSIDMVPDFEYAPGPGEEFLAEINPYLLFPPQEGIYDPDPEKDGIVGTINGSLSVSPTGAATYSIPIGLPPGRAGMTPELGFVYSSQAGNGLMGVGWNIAGLSAISRAGTNLYHEDFIDGVDFDDNDKLVLDGARLIPVNTEQTEFRTEIESFQKLLLRNQMPMGLFGLKFTQKEEQYLNMDTVMIQGLLHLTVMKY